MGRHGSAMVRAPWLSVIATMPSGPQKRTENALALTKEMPEPRSEQVADAAGIAIHEAPSRIEAGADVSVPALPPHAREKSRSSFSWTPIAWRI